MMSQRVDFRASLGSRLREVERKFPNRAAAASMAGVARSTLQAWIEGKSDASFEGLSRLADAAEVSLDWLATGHEPATSGGAIDLDRMDEIIKALADELYERNMMLPQERFAELCGVVYEMLRDAEPAAQKRVLSNALRLVSSR